MRARPQLRRAASSSTARRQVTDTVPFRLLNNHVYVEAMVNGKGPYTFIVDTGGHTLLSPRVVKEVGLESVGESQTAGAGDKTATSGYAHYEEIAVGKARLRDQVGFTIEIYQPSIEGIQVDGMIGFEYFSRFAVRLDYGALTMTTTRFTHFDAKDAGAAVPFKFYDHLPQVTGSARRQRSDSPTHARCCAPCPLAPQVSVTFKRGGAEQRTTLELSRSDLGAYRLKIDPRLPTGSAAFHLPQTRESVAVAVEPAAEPQRRAADAPLLAAQIDIERPGIRPDHRRPWQGTCASARRSR